MSDKTQYTSGPYKVFIGSNFDPLFKESKAEVITMKGDNGGPQAIGQFYKVVDAELFISIAETASERDRLQSELAELKERYEKLKKYEMIANAIIQQAKGL